MSAVPVPVTLGSGRPPSPSTVTVDGRSLSVADDLAAAPLAEVLRAAGHTAPKVGCQEGSCGACTVLLDDRPVPSCLVPAARALGHRVDTAAGLTRAEPGATLAAELARRGALQCGFCVPGLLVSAVALLRAGDPGDRDGRARALAGHLCRCTGYQGLLDAVDRAAGADPR